MLQAICYLLHVISYMLHAICYMLHATRYMLHNTSYIPHAISYLLYATATGYIIQATWYMLHAPCYIIHATCYILHECLCWLIYRYYMNCLVTTWLFCMYILDLNALAGWSRATTWTPLLLHEFLKHMLSKVTVGWSIAYYMSSLHTTWLFEHIYWI